MRNVVRVGGSVPAVLLVIGTAVGSGMGVYQASDNRQPDDFNTGGTDTTDRVSMTATIEKADPAQYVTNVRVWGAKPAP